MESDTWNATVVNGNGLEMRDNLSSSLRVNGMRDRESAEAFCQIRSASHF